MTYARSKARLLKVWIQGYIVDRNGGDGLDLSGRGFDHARP